MASNFPEAMDTTSPVPLVKCDETEDDDEVVAREGADSNQVLLSEFEDWQSEGKKIRLKESKLDPDDGKTSLHFSMDSGQTFILYCPIRYPKYSTDEDNFFVEADSGLQLWCNALNEFLLDSDSRLTLRVILNKGLSLYSSADEAAANDNSFPSTSGTSSSNHFNNCVKIHDSDEDDENDNANNGLSDEEDMDLYEEDDQAQGDDEQLEDILDNDLSWELEISRRKKRWRLKENELRAEKLKSSDSGIPEEDRTLQQLYHDPGIKNRQPKQVFTSAAASGILTNDLVQIMETSANTGIEADTVDDNIFQWNVKISNFQENCPLDKDFQELKQMHDYDYMELQLDFSMDLYPFFPPLVKVIRPRLQGSMMLRVTTMEILKLSYWNPARDMKSVLVDIKSFLQTWARLDLLSERNDRGRYSEGAYIDIEHHLLRLALVSEIVPRANKKYVITTPPKATLPPTAMESAGASSMLSRDLLRSKKSPEAATDKEKKTSKSKFALFGIMPKDKDEKKKTVTSTKNMAKGVGYSSYQQKGWDVKAYMAAQKEKDKQVELVLGKIHQELKRLHGNQQPPGPRNPPDLLEGTSKATVNNNNNSSSSNSTSSVGGAIACIDLTSVGVDSAVGTGDTGAGTAGTNCNNRGGSTRRRERSPDELKVIQEQQAGGEKNGDDDEEEEAINPQSDLFAVLEGSALVPFLESKLQANSFLEICNHQNVYKCVINITREIANQPSLVSLLGPLPEQATSLHSLLLALESQAEVLLEKIGKAAANGSVPKSSSKSAAEKSNAEKSSHDNLAREFLRLSREATNALKTSGYLPDINGQSNSSSTAFNRSTAEANMNDVNMSSDNENNPKEHSSSSTSSAPQPGTSGLQMERKSREEKAANLYKKHMADFQYDSCEFSLSGSQAHHFSASFNKAGTPSSQVIIRVAQEVSSLATSLPLDFSSAIYLRSDDDKVTLLKAIITGPEGTPYTGGCYQFDIFFPSKYPQTAPHVNFRTTGGGLVRFNPNLYNCGKVCLSLLGTWEGAQGEQWNETSTILQVLISIQSLILCAEPYYNEPGYERLYGTPQGDSDSLRYSEDVFRNNLKYAILGQLQTPPEGFEDVIKAHFFLKRNLLLEELEKTSEKFKGKDIGKLLLEVRRELMKLEQPPNLKDTFKSAT